MHWQALVLLGAWHGINPGMGWLFAVALGMQHGSARGVWRALPPIALGHAVSVAAVVLAAGLLRLVVPLAVLNALVAAMLIAMGAYKLWRHRHPRGGGMQVGFRELTTWSFLMASAHGAGLMVLPFILPASAVFAAGHQHADHAAHMASTAAGGGLAAVALHTASYLTVMTVAAWVVYRRLGLSLLRSAWFNVDWMWAAALVVTGLVGLAR